MERNAGHCLYPQVFHGLRSKFVRGMKDPGNPRFLSSTNHGSGHVDAGNSFLAHLYGPPSLLQLDTDFQELSDRKFCTSYSNCTAASGNFVVNSTEGGTFQPSRPFALEQCSSKQAFPFTSGCPLVFCMGKSGYLLLSNTGLLGIVCSCHCCHMSVLKFCEHSGLYGADPGDAVRMESGETIAQWQKLYFLKFQIRSQGNESEWDWPEALSTTRSLMKSNASAQSSTSASDLSHVLSSSAVILRKRPPTVQDGCDISLKGFTGISQDNLYGQVNSQLMESNLAMYTTVPKLVGTGADNDCQPLPPFPNSRKRNENLSIAHAPSQTATSFLKHHEFIINKNAKHGLVGRVAASSNIGLKHGQLPKKGYPVSSFIEPLLFNALVTPPKSQPPKQMINQLDKEEDFSCAAGSFKMVEELPQLELRNYMSGVSNSLGADKGRSEIDNVPKGLYFSPFPQFNPQPEGKSKSSENLVNDDGLIMPKKLHSEFSPTQFGSTNVLWNNIVHTGRQLDNSANKILDNNRGARFTKDSSDTINTAFGISQLMEYPSSIPGPVSGSYNGKIYESHHESSLPTNTSVDANFLHATEKVSLPLGQDNQVISEAVIPFEVNTKGFPFLVSSYTSNQNPTFLQQRSINMDTSLLDENMRLLALTQILELSKQQHALYLHEMNQKQGRFSNISKVQHCIYDASASEQGTSGATLELPQNGGICGNPEVTCDSGKLSSLAGLNRHCCRSALAQPLHSKEKESHCTSYDLRSEEPSLSLGTNKDNNRSSECAKFTEQPSDLHYAAQANGSGSNFFSGIGASHYTSKQQYANASGETSLKIASKYSRDENILKNVNIHFEQDVILDGQDSIKISSDSPRWRDVPNKTGKEVCDATASLDQAGTILGSELQDGVQLGNISAKRLKRTIDIEDLLKEQENSNVSSGCSAPVVTQASAEVNKVDSCSADAGDTSCVNNLVLDEMSGIDKSWSSDAVESGRSAGLLGSTSKSYLKKGYLQVLNDQACHSILDEHKLLDSPTCKKGQDQNNITLSINRSANQAQKIKKGSKGKKRKRKEVRILDASLSSGIPFVLRNKNGESTGVFNSPSSLSKEMQMYSSYSQKRLAISASFVEPSTKLRNSTFLSKIFSSKNHLGKRHSNKEDICESESNSNAEFHALPEVFGRKKLRKDITSDFFGHFQMQESAWQEPENANPKLFSGRMTNSLRIRKPVVCGKYGEICSGQLSGDVPKPAKLVSLSKVLESCKRCTVPSNGKTRLISKRNWKRPSFGANYGCCSGQPDLKTEEENKPKYKVTCNETNFDVSIEGWERGKKQLVIYKAKKDTEAKLHGSIVNRVDAPLKLKSKGIRKQRSIYELTANGVNDEKVGFYGTCVLHAMNLVDKMGRVEEKEITCARTEGYKGRKRDGFLHNCYGTSKTKNGCLVPEEQLNAWVHINGQKPCSQGLPKIPASDVEHDCRKEYARYKQAKGWRHLVVYKSGIHGLGLYTSLFISRGAMVVEYVGEIVGLRVSDKRENEYQSGRKLQYKSACYFFKIDKEHIIDATRKGGIARFVNHSCLPNCVAKVITVRHEKKVVFFAERDILPGEEITYDYHFNHEDEGKKIPCYCNSKNCRRYLN